MNSNHLKYLIISWLIYHRNYIGAVTEYDGADIIGIRRTLYVSEFEIKTSKNDLIRELKIIANILGEENLLYTNKENEKIYSNTKYSKHRINLREKMKMRYYGFTPNEFSYIVPMELADIVYKYIKDTKYGAYMIEPDERSYFKSSIEEIKRPQKIHDKKIDEREIIKFFRKLSTENDSLREKIYRNEVYK